MAFPVTGILDDFDRADGGLGSDWDDSIGISVGEIVSNQARCSNPSFSTFALWTPSTFGADQESRATIEAGGDGVGFLLRASADGQNYYLARFTAGNIVRIDKNVAGSFSAVSSDTYTFPSAGDGVGAEVIDDTITIYHDAGGVGSWAVAYTDTDSDLASGDYIGFTVATSVEINDWGGGEIVNTDSNIVLRDPQVAGDIAFEDLPPPSAGDDYYLALLGVSG